MMGPAPKFDRAIRELLEANPGITNQEIADSVGTSTRNVTRRRARMGLSGENRGRPLSWSEEALIPAQALLEDGASYRDVSETTGIPRTTLQERFPGMGFTPEDTARLATTLPKLPERLRWSLTRNRKD